MIRVRVLGTDYGSSWVRELTRALFPDEELFAAAAETLRSESLGSSSVYSKAYHTRITRLRASGTGFQTLQMMGIWCLGPRARYGWTTMVSQMAILLQRGVFFHKRASVSKFYFRCF